MVFAPDSLVDAGESDPVSDLARNVSWVMLTAAAVVMISAFLPWFEVMGISVDGIGGEDVGGAKDGALTLLLSIPVLVLAILRVNGKAMLGAAITAVVMGALVTLIAIADMSDIEDFPSASIKVGLWLTLVGGIAMGVGGIVGIVRRR